MKNYTYFLNISLIGIITFLTGSYTVAQDLPGDTLQLPFTENWSSGSFTSNNWSFPNGQGAWVVENNYGDPSPSAAFYGFPPITNYSYKLYSTWVDGKEFQYSDIWLDFDLKLFVVSVTGTEKLTIGKGTDTSWSGVVTLKNDSSFGWKHFHIHFGSANNHYFKIGFVASGVNSASLDCWYIDNIHLDYVCKPPSGLNSWAAFDYLADTVYLFWTPPNSGNSGNMMDFIYDDGTMENGWAISQGNNGWLGNEFPTLGMAGTIESISTLWWANTCLPPAITIDFFDENHAYLATSDTFYSSGTTWTTVPINNVPFNGTFYAMVHWTPTTNCSYYLGDDENGPYASQDLAWYTDGTLWEKVSSFPAGNPGVFLLRATIMVTDGMNKSELFSSHSQSNILDVNDSMMLTGYNIYRKFPDNDSSFIRINTNPVTIPQYYDPVVCSFCPGYFYYVTSIYNDAATGSLLCESAGTDTIFTYLWVNVGEKKEKTLLKVFPVPANTFITLQSDKIITGVEIYDHLGVTWLTKENLRKNEYSLAVDNLSPGLYFLKVLTVEGIITRKILVLH